MTHRILRRVPRLGRTWFLVSLFLLGIGLFKGINLLALLAWVLLVIFLWNARIAGRSLSRLQARRSIEGPIFAGSPFVVEVVVENHGPVLRQPVVVHDPGIGVDVRHLLPGMRSGDVWHWRRDAMLPCRGLVCWPALRLTDGYPFGLVEREASFGEDLELRVLPRLGRLHRGRLRRLLTATGPASPRARPNSRRHPTAQTEFHGLRAFRSGDSPRWIHWRTSARCAELMVREFEELPADNLTLILDPWLPSDREEDQTALESAVSFAATVCWEWCRQKGDRFLFVVAGREPVVLEGLTSDALAVRMLECLAEIKGSPESGLNDLAEALDPRRILPGPVLVIGTTPGPSAGELGEHWRHRVTVLHVPDLACVDFYEAPNLSEGSASCASQPESASALR